MRLPRKVRRGPWGIWHIGKVEKDQLIAKTLYDISSVLNSIYAKIENLHGADESIRLRLVDIDKQIVSIINQVSK